MNNGDKEPWPAPALNPIERLPPEMLDQILNLMPPGRLIRFGRINRQCRNITKHRLVELGALGSYPYSVYNSTLASSQSKSAEDLQAQQRLILFRGNLYTFLFHENTDCITTAVRRLLETCYNDHIEAFRRLLDLHGPDGLPERVSNTSEYSTYSRDLNAFLFNPAHEEFAWACLRYVAGMKLINGCSSRHMQRPHYKYVSGSGIHGGTTA